MECRRLTRSGLVVLVTCAIAGVSGLARAQCECPAMSIEAVGHRGTGIDSDDNAFPENTIPSFVEAVREGATMVELDVQHSADGALIVIHDDTVNRTTDGAGCVGDLTLAELQALDAKGGQLPTLLEVFSAVDVAINVEIKVDEGDGCPATDRVRLGADVAAAVAADGGGREILVSSFDLDQLLAVRAADDAVKLALLTFGGEGFDTAIDQDFAAVNPLAGGTRPGDVERAQAAGLEVNPWTVNDVLTMHRLAGMGVDRIITDEPDRVPEAMRSYCEALVCGDAGPGGADSGGATDAGPDAGSEEVSGGGGCSVARGRRPSSGLLFLAPVLFLWRRGRER
ncbi:MAG: hypothetical protein JRH11_05845 [Deltaproteobacteria bacterium]|nr:hypothetical protein [Deltaproteobacteria bacterium]